MSKSIVNISHWESTSQFFDKTWDISKTKDTALPVEYSGLSLNGFDTCISSSRRGMVGQTYGDTVSPIQGEPKLISSGEENILNVAINNPTCEHDGIAINMLKFKSYYYFGIEESKFVCYKHDEYIGENNYYTAKMEMKDYREIGEYKKGFCFSRPISSSNSLFKDTVPSFTINARTAMIEGVGTTDDGSKISESFAKRLSYITKETIKINIKKGDIPVNIHENDWLPAIGDELKDKIVCAFRRDSQDILLTDVSDDTMPLYDRTIRTKLNNPVVTAIRAYNNKSANAKQDDYEDECNYYVDSVKEDARAMVEYIEHLFERAEKENLGLSSQIYALYAIVKTASADGKRTAKYGEKGALYYIEIDLTSVNKCGVGHKIMNNGAAKTMVYTVVPDDQMVMDANGIIADIELEASEINRMNIGLVHEMYLGGVFYLMLERLRGSDNPVELWDEYVELLSHTESKQYYHYKTIEDELTKELIISECIETGTMYVHRNDNYIDAGLVVTNITRSRFALDESGFYDQRSGLFLGEGYVGVVATFLLNKTSYDGSASGSSYTNGLSVAGLSSNRLEEYSFSIKPPRTVSETSMRIDSRTHGETGFVEELLALTSMESAEEYVTSMTNTGELPKSFKDSGHKNPKVQQFNGLLAFFGSKTSMVNITPPVIEQDVTKRVKDITPKLLRAKEIGVLDFVNEYVDDLSYLTDESLKEASFDKGIHIADNWVYPAKRYGEDELTDEFFESDVYKSFKSDTLDDLLGIQAKRTEVDDTPELTNYLTELNVGLGVKDVIKERPMGKPDFSSYEKDGGIDKVLDYKITKGKLNG